MEFMDALATDAVLRSVARALEGPTHLLLLASAAAVLWELGVYLQERFGGPGGASASAVTALGRRRIDRADLLARGGPMLGLMGTLIPLGPGLTALGQGDVATLAAAVTVAFDTTVLGLAVGIVAFGLGRARRRMYDRWLDDLEAEAPAVEPAPPMEPARALE